MRHWQPIHHARWRDFIAGLAAALRGEIASVAPVIIVAPAPVQAVAPIAALAAPSPVQISVPPPAIPPAPEPEIEPAILPTSAPVTVAPPAPIAITAPVAAVPAPPPAKPQVESVPSVAPLPVSESRGSARAFFAALGWLGGPAVRRAPAPASAPLASPVPSLAPEAPAAPLSPSTSSAFFRALPWSGDRALGEIITSIRVTATRADASLDPRTASLPGDNPLLTGMLSAARTSDRIAARAPSPARARPYFNALPWSR